MTKIYAVVQVTSGWSTDEDTEEVFEHFASRERAEQTIDGLIDKPCGQAADGWTWLGRWAEGDFEIREFTLR